MGQYAPRRGARRRGRRRCWEGSSEGLDPRRPGAGESGRGRSREPAAEWRVRAAWEQGAKALPMGNPPQGLPAATGPAPSFPGRALAEARSLAPGPRAHPCPLTCFTASKVRGNRLRMGPLGHSTSSSSSTSPCCKRGERLGGWVATSWGRVGGAPRAAAHLPQGHGAVGVLGGGGRHRTLRQGLELNSKPPLGAGQAGSGARCPLLMPRKWGRGPEPCLALWA